MRATVPKLHYGLGFASRQPGFRGSALPHFAMLFFSKGECEGGEDKEEFGMG